MMTAYFVVTLRGIGTLAFISPTSFVASLPGIKARLDLLLARSQEQVRSRPTYSAPVGALATLLVTTVLDAAWFCSGGPP